MLKLRLILLSCWMQMFYRGITFATDSMRIALLRRYPVAELGGVIRNIKIVDIIIVATVFVYITPMYASVVALIFCSFQAMLEQAIRDIKEGLSRNR